MDSARAHIGSGLYTDASVLEAERRSIFASNWCYVAPVVELPEPGSYLATAVNGWPIIVTRTSEGRLRAFHNVCRHRGAGIMAEGSGRCRLMVCPYHSWSYDLEGRLIRAPNFGDDAGLDHDVHGLLPVEVDTWSELIFVRISDTGPSLPEWLGDLPEIASEHPGPGDLEYFDGFVLEGAMNWKLFCENTVEGYHLPSVHQRLNSLIDTDRSTIRSYNDGRLVVFHVTYASEGVGLRGSEGIWWYLFPGFQGVASARGFKAERIEPLGARRMRFTDWSWVHPCLSEEERRENFDWSQDIVREDIAPCETIQSNLESGVFRGGPLSPTQEQHVAGFQKLVDEALEAHFRPLSTA